VKKLLALILALAIAAPAFATPIITGSSGTAANGATFTLTGTGFGTKASGVQTPYSWSNFEDGATQPIASLSSNTSWVVQHLANATDFAVSGTHSLKSDATWNALASNGSTEICGIKSTVAGMVRGSKLYMAYWKKATYTWHAGENWKIWRFWTPFDGNNYPNIYEGSEPHNSSCSGGGARFNNVESCAASTNKTYTNGYTMSNGSGAWRLEEFLLQVNSGSGVADGKLIIKVNGQVVTDQETFRSDCASWSGANFQDLWTEDNYSNYENCPNAAGSRPTGSIWKDDVYIEKGWQRVYLTDAPTLVGSTKFFLQPHTAWTSVGTTIKLNYGNLTGNVYAYICDDSNVCSTDGWLVASGVIGDPPPGDPCENVVCGGNEYCLDGNCIANASTNEPTADPDLRLTGGVCPCAVP
jgi:hypothetical protein